MFDFSHLQKDRMIWSTERKAEFYRRALLRLVVGLYALAEVVPEGDGQTFVTRRVRNGIFRVLRPAESAARRLIFNETRRMEEVAYVPPPARDKSKRTGTGQTGSGKKRGRRKPRFRLIDPRKFLAELYPNRRTRRRRAAGKPSTEPKLLARIAGFDGQPDCAIWSEPQPEVSPDDPVDATRMLRRMEALKLALEDVPTQAQRMLREIAKRKAAPPGPASVPPLRYGLPPGFCKRGDHEVFEILSECHKLAIPPRSLIPAPPDTS